MILLDTNVVSEVMRERPDHAVRGWLKSLPKRELWTASVVIAELLSGIDLMPAGRKKEALREGVEGMIAEDFRGQVLKFDVSAARHYGQILAFRKQQGRPIREMDALIAATAKSNNATLATRNPRDFEHCGIPLINPCEPI